MKIKISELKKIIIKEAGFNNGNRPSKINRLDFSTGQLNQYNAELHSDDDVYRACMDLFNSIGPDLALETEDPSDPAFIDYVGDTMTDAGIPYELIDNVILKLQGRSGGMRR